MVPKQTTLTQVKSLGDSGFSVIRGTTLVHQQAPQTHFFNCPKQVNSVIPFLTMIIIALSLGNSPSYLQMRAASLPVLVLTLRAKQTLSS